MDQGFQSSHFLLYQCYLGKWRWKLGASQLSLCINQVKEAWESVGSGAGRDSQSTTSPQGGGSTASCTAIVATSIKAVLQEGLELGLRHNI